MKKEKNYTGNKLIPGVIHKIINEIPEHKQYYEIFAGSGAVGTQLPGTTVKHYNDLNKTILDRILCTAGEKIIKTSIPAADILQSLIGSGIDTFIFADPPYLHSCRHSSKLYDHEMSNSDHIRLLYALQSLKCNVMVIHPACKLYDKLLQSWRSVELKIRYNRKTSIERIYMNYKAPEILQSYKFIGKDCWQRQGYKRKAERFLKKGLPIPFPGASYVTDMTKNDNPDPRPIGLSYLPQVRSL